MRDPAVWYDLTNTFFSGTQSDGGGTTVPSPLYPKEERCKIEKTRCEDFANKKLEAAYKSCDDMKVGPIIDFFTAPVRADCRAQALDHYKFEAKSCDAGYEICIRTN